MKKIARIWRGNYVIVEIPDDVYDWPAHRKEITNRAGELDEIIYAILKGATEMVQ